MSILSKTAVFLALALLGCSSSGGGAAFGGAAGQAGTTASGGGTGGATTGGTSSGGLAGQGGAASDCTVDADCPAAANECQVSRCTAGRCKVVFVSFGTPTVPQTAGDCSENECDGRGAIVAMIDDTDVHDDLDPCTTDSCANGTPANIPVATGTACGNGLSCDANGACAGCTNADQCPGTDTECRTRVCVAGTCGYTYAPAGKLLQVQMRADCAEDHCDGSGGVTQYLDAADVVVDGLDCTDDICNSLYPENPPVAAGTTCNQDGGSKCDGTGSCVECLLDADCGASTECLIRSCVTGACVAAPVAEGTAIIAQTLGDCEMTVCDGSGGVRADADDTDRPDDNNPCTTDTCNSGSTVYTPVSPGTLCGDGLACDASGECAGCASPEQCPGTDDECKTRTCNAAVCGFDYTTSGTALAAQTPGDCREVQCDGQGSTRAVPIDDAPVDGNVCTADQCVAGTPSNPPLAQRTPCGSGKWCDGAGVCAECLLASDCGTNNQCRTYACTSANMCSHSDAPDLTPISIQVPGDCKESVCDGQGNIKSLNKDGDLPLDNNECTEDKCTSGVASNPALASGTACSAGVCDGSGSCTQCVVKTDCGTDTLCRTFSCSSNACGHTDAPSGTVCSAGVCDGTGSCVECVGETDCGTDTECRTYSCVDHQCGHADTAKGTPVSTQAAGDCKKVVCDTGTMVTVNDSSDVPADDGKECTDETCNAGFPEHPPLALGTACATDGGQYCDAGAACVECVSNDQCTSLICTAGACQPSACDDLVMNGDETDVDCGGGICDTCAQGLHCLADIDCASSNCVQTVCEPAN